LTAHIANLGRRIELVPIDPHCNDITLALYERGDDRGRPTFRIHSYSSRAEARQRISFITEAMKVLGGMEAASPPGELLGFPCGQDHRLACRRTFLEACKLPTGTALAARPLTVDDRKSGRAIRVVGLGDGAYRLESDGADEAMSKRLDEIASGFVKLAQMRAVDGVQPIAFACRQPHDAIMGLLLPRALNVRAALREQEQAAGRGILVAPSAQQQ